MLLFFLFFSFSLVEILAGDGNCGRTKFPRFQIFYAIVKEKRLWFTGFLRGSKIIFTLICSGCANKPTWERRGSMNSGTFIVTRTWRILSDITCRLSRLNYWTVIIIRRSCLTQQKRRWWVERCGKNKISQQDSAEEYAQRNHCTCSVGRTTSDRDEFR